jgi:hypothetical protein
MTAPTSHARAHLPDAGCCHDDNPPNLPNCTKSQTVVASDLESRAIAMLDDDQLWATFYRWRTVLRGETAARSLRERLSVSEYVDAIFSSVPE